MAAVALALALWLLAAPASAQIRFRFRSQTAGAFAAPVGIPTPPFGITETAPARPSPWTSDQAGYYYVDAGTGTDSGRTYGNPTAPRATIPATLAAGAVVELHGTYATTHTTPINGAGTSGSPVYIRGQNASTKPTITSRFNVGGSYTILENLAFSPDSTAGKWALMFTTNVDTTGGDHLVLRASTVVGNASDSGGVGVFDYNAAGGRPTYVVVWNNVISDAGDYDGMVNRDYHCVTTSYSDHIWVLENELTRCEGDGLQITGVGPASWDNTSTHHIYAGRNTTYNNQQNGLWSKFATDVIFSENISYDNKASVSSDGACFGAQYATDYLWIVNNLCADSDYGILIASDIDTGLTMHTFLIGNLIYLLSDSADTWTSTSGSSFATCGISMRASGPKYLYENTIYSTQGHGICLPSSPSNASMALYNNILDTPRASTGRHVIVDNGSTTIVSGGNLFGPNYSQDIAGSVTTLTAPQTLTGNNLVRSSSGFVNAAAQNFRLDVGSAGIDTDTGANVQTLYDAFQARYGLSIQYDRDRVARPRASVYDAGAFER